MKRLLLAVLLLLCLPAAPALAETQTCDLVSPAFSVDLPDDWDLLTAGMATDDPLLEKYDLDKTALDSLFADNDIWLNAIPQDQSGELTITVTQNSKSERLFDLNLHSDSDLLAQLKHPQVAGGPEYTAYGVYQQAEAKFLYTVLVLDGKYGLQYTTVINGVSIVLTYYDYDGAAALDQIKPRLLKIVDSFHAAQILDPPSLGPLGRLWHSLYAALGAVGIGVIAALLLALAVFLALYRRRPRPHAGR